MLVCDFASENQISQSILLENFSEWLIVNIVTNGNMVNIVNNVNSVTIVNIVNIGNIGNICNIVNIVIFVGVITI